MTETTSGKLAAYPRYARDFLADTRHLPLDARGAYGDLLDHQWLQGSVPEDPATLGRLWGCPAAQAARVWALIADKFPEGEDGLRRNRRLERERAAAEVRIGRAKKGARAKHHSSTTPSSAQAGAQTGPKQVLKPCITVAVAGSVSETDSSTTARERLPDDYRPDYDALRRASHSPETLDREVLALTSGRHPTIDHLTPEDVGVGMRELVLAGAPQSKLSRFAQVARDQRLHPRPSGGHFRAGHDDDEAARQRLLAKYPEEANAP